MKINKIKKYEELEKIFFDGMTVMIGGFLGCGVPDNLIDYLVSINTKDLTIIANDTTFENEGIGKLIGNNQVKKVIVTHVGTNPMVGKYLFEGKLEVELVPQGTLIERIRAGGYGLGGILTPTGVGTEVEKGKKKIIVDNKEFLLELPIRGDVSLIYATQSDEFGNLYYEGTTKNFNEMMCMASDKVIVLPDELVKTGKLDKSKIMTPGVVVDYIVGGVKND